MALLNVSVYKVLPGTAGNAGVGMEYTGMILAATLAVIGNGLLIITVVSHRRLRTTTNAFIVSLAVADFLFAFPFVPIYIMAENARGPILGIPLPIICLGVMSLSGIQLIITITTLFVLTLERYVSISFPLKHRKWSQPRHVSVIISLVWIYSALMGAIPLMGWNSLRYHNPWEKSNNDTQNLTVHPRCTFALVNTGPYLGLLLVLNILPVSLWLPYMYTSMFLTVRRFVARRSLKGSPKGVNLEEMGASLSSRAETPRRNDSQPSPAGTRKSLQLLAVIAIYGVFSWLPTTVWYIVATRGFTRQYLSADMINNVPLPSFYYHLSITLGFANSAINPYIFGLGNVPIRRVFCGMFRNGKRVSRQRAHESISHGDKATIRNNSGFV